jgi:hypothetical protein
MELDPARMTLLTGFSETYFILNEEEERMIELLLLGKKRAE